MRYLRYSHRYLLSCYKLGRFGPWSIHYIDWSIPTERDIKRTKELSKIYDWE